MVPGLFCALPLPPLSPLHNHYPPSEPPHPHPLTFTSAADLPTCTCFTDLYGNQQAMRMCAHISQNADKEFPESTEIVTWTDESSLPAKSVVGRWWSYCLLIFAYFKPFPGLKFTADPDRSKVLYTDWLRVFLHQWKISFDTFFDVIDWWCIRKKRKHPVKTWKYGHRQFGVLTELFLE